ncbi:uncharacterized protein A4U43_C07F13800 [Asparagus officinalis]|uniref:Uncharacterized protein n=1 Tax=Asparagus officinalis TaxID=4686 RepID=A0A5P1EF38_ASPOF|nr:uncharacterized protein A4U43_C07F13800 [Asparagus officinalis]
MSSSSSSLFSTRNSRNSRIFHRRPNTRGATWTDTGKKPALVEAEEEAVGPAEGSDSGAEEVGEEEGEESGEQGEGDREEAQGRESPRRGSVCGELHVHAALILPGSDGSRAINYREPPLSAMNCKMISADIYMNGEVINVLESVHEEVICNIDLTFHNVMLAIREIYESIVSSPDG